jgi:hypothetical protein
VVTRGKLLRHISRKHPQSIRSLLKNQKYLNFVLLFLREHSRSINSFLKFKSISKINIIFISSGLEGLTVFQPKMFTIQNLINCSQCKVYHSSGDFLSDLEVKKKFSLFFRHAFFLFFFGMHFLANFHPIFPAFSRKSR